MAYQVKVAPNLLECRNKESVSAPHDIFALAGAVIVDGEAHGFALPSVPINERQPHTYIETVFEGFSESPQIGLSLVGWDIDDNEKWVSNREEIDEISKKISEGAEYVPVLGEYVGWLAENIPKIVDQFVEWDKNDLLLQWSGTVDLSAQAAVPFVKSTNWTEVKFRHDDVVGYSDWDYSLHVRIECTFTPPAPFGGGETGEKSLQPYLNTRLSDWIGEWDSASGKVQCSIRPSDNAIDLLDVSVSETVDGETTDTVTPRVGISKVFLQFGGVHEAGKFVEGLEGKARKGGAVWLSPRLTVERIRGHTASVTNLIEGQDQPVVIGGFGIPDGGPEDKPKPLQRGGARVPVEDASTTLIGAGGEIVTPEWANEIFGKPPKRQQSGSDLLELSNDAVLEIYHVLRGGKQTGQVELRYVRPVANIAWRPSSAVDEMLTLRVV